MILAEAIKLYCEAHDISVRELSGMLGMTNPMVISRYFSGKSIRSDHFAKILEWSLQKPSNPDADHQP